MRGVLEFISPYVAAVEEEMKALLKEPSSPLTSFYAMMRYHLGWADEAFSPSLAWGGKRIRPVLCLLVCEAISGGYGKALPAAAAVELLHNFSLVHDDIEDHSPIRRGRATVWSLWGQPQAINVGDGLFVLAHLALQRLVDPALISKATQILDEACLALTEGQFLDLSLQGREEARVEEYLGMAEKKTASLLECAAHLGAFLAMPDEAIIGSYRAFARKLGLAFQVSDDLLGLWGEEERTGKERGEDIRSGKKSLPLVYAFQEERRRGSKKLTEIYGQAPVDIDSVLSRLEELEAKRYAEEMAQRFHDEALEELEKTAIDNPVQGRLRELAHFLIRRGY